MRSTSRSRLRTWLVSPMSWFFGRSPSRLLVLLAIAMNAALLLQVAQTRWWVVEDTGSISYSFRDRHIYQHAIMDGNDTSISQCLSKVNPEYMPYLLTRSAEVEPTQESVPMPSKEKELCLFLKVLRHMEYTVYPDVFQAKINTNQSKTTLVTQLSHARLERFALHAAKWLGPISITLYVPKNMLLSTMLAWCHFKELCHRDNIQLHIVVEKGIFYPVNFLRNVAVKYVKTELTYVVDADVMPMPNMEERIHEHLKARPLNESEVFVVPTFESYDGSCCDTMPASKEEIVKLWDEGFVGPFYFQRYKPAYAPINYKKWRTASEVYKVPFYKQFEPYIIIHTSKTPTFHTGFYGLYYDKASFTLEVYSRGNDFLILPDVFNFHIYHDFTHDSTKDAHFLCMFKAWQEFMKSMVTKYGEDKSLPPVFDEVDLELPMEEFLVKAEKDRLEREKKS